jgi:SAM-dependent methyltransferase
MCDAIDLSEYADPVLYDSENTAFEPDGPFYLDLARQAGGPVLELGCGPGRLTIPLAREGLDITGLDVTAGMLARAQAQAGALPIRWVEADARAFRLGRRFGAVLATGGLFQHMLGRADQEALLACVREHLAPVHYNGFALDAWYGVLGRLLPDRGRASR